MSQDRSDQEPAYGEETDQDPHHPADGDTSAEHEATEGGGSDGGPAHPDLHGAAREVAESASGDGPAKTPGG